MSASPLEVKRSILEKRLADLTEEYVAANAQLDRNLNDIDRLRIKREAEHLYQNMEQVDSELRQLDATDQNPNRNYLDLQEKLPNIDFKEAMGIFDGIMEQFGREGGAAIFLLHNSYPMAGKLCIAKMREQLISSTADFKYYPVELSPEGRLDEFGILERLAQYVDVELTSDKQQYARSIIRKICKSLQSGSVVFLELKKWDELSAIDKVLTWFINNFWVPLVSQLPTIAQTYRKVKLIVVIVSDTELPSEYLKLPCYCSKDEFSQEKLLKLPLKNWTIEDIEDWLDSYSGLPGNRIDSMAKKLYKVSCNGIPALVCNALLEEFE